jgi:hypothetical protein
MLDSNLELSYDNVMFNKLSGKINNKGIWKIFENLQQIILVHNDWYGLENSNLHWKEDIEREATEEDFFLL